MPGEPVPAPRFTVTARWTLESALDYVRSWSGAAAYREATGRDPAELVRDELAALFGEGGESGGIGRESDGTAGDDPGAAAAVRTVRMPLFLRAVRL
jgi:hypothetical protein